MRQSFSIGDSVVSALVDGDGPLLVLLHGAPSGAELWRHLVEPLAAAGHRVMAPDLPGYGATRLGRGGDYSLAGSADLLARWIEAEELGPAWVVGHDIGGGVAQILAARHPSLVGRLTLANSIADGSWPAPRARFATWSARLGLYRPAAWLHLVPNPYLRREVRRGFAEERVGDTIDAVDSARIFWDGKFSDPAGRRSFERHLAALRPADTAAVVGTLPRLSMPCQLVWGVADPFQKWDTTGRRLLGLLPEPDVTLLDGCGHFTPLECPERFVAALLDWADIGRGDG
jgi:pimeloyl-ACP methyl ester carboxylesterase